jgi:DNA-directed RNA polymerase specialized sigma24 family protein
MHLTVIEGCSDAEIGALMGIAAASVRSHRRRARQRLEVLWNTSPSG